MEYKITVAELKEYLNEFPDNLFVICQKDPEGNGHSPLGDMWQGSYTPESTWHGEAHLSVLTAELQEHGLSEEDVRRPGEGDTVAALFLVPVN